MHETILVTGGAGFIGSNFVHRWHRSHPEGRILVLDKLTYAANPSHIAGLDRVELVKGDIQNRELVTHLLDKHGIRKLVHFAAESHVDNSITGPAAFIQTNMVGTFGLLDAAREVWAGDKDTRFLHVSTDEVYGSLGETGKFHEEMAYAPNSPYSASKAGSDHLVRAYHHTYGLQTLTTNCSNNYGPRQHPEKLIPLAISRMAQNQPIPVYGDGQNIRDWLFVEDHCTAIETVIAKGTPGETYCIGGNNEWKNLDLLHLLCDLVDQQMGRPDGTSRKLLTFVKDRAGHDQRYAIDASRMEALGWHPDHAFRQGLIRTVKWCMDNNRQNP
ncbi:dTDP-glucose 4,6-dehydratase [Holophaga foetida]|uniref:dTDP-glucose 4,6-dehydratase n=1 Tax=Holophaga foetida TaxID=35839 RepID=UPI0002473B40|nr:dTDP-glucose 4,6-dehydratase [Holophaga foetida]